MKKTAKIFFIIFLVVLVGALVALFIPQNYKNFSFLNIETQTIHGGGLNKNIVLDFDILNKTSNTYNDVDVKIYFTTKNTRGVQTKIVEDLNIKSGLNNFNDIVLKTYQSISDDVFYEVSGVSLKYQASTSYFDIYASGKISPTGWGIICVVIIGVIGSLTSMFVFLTNAKFASNIKDFEQKVKESFEKIIPNTAEKEQLPKKTICKYCKTTYNSDLDRCPNCGAPFEP